MACNNPACHCKGQCPCKSGRPCHCTAGKSCPGCASAHTGGRIFTGMGPSGDDSNQPPPNGQRTPDLIVTDDSNSMVGRRRPAVAPPAAPAGPPPESLYHGRVEHGDWNWGGQQQAQHDGMGISDSDPLNEAAFGPFGRAGRPGGNWHVQLNLAVQLLGKKAAGKSENAHVSKTVGMGMHGFGAKTGLLLKGAPVVTKTEQSFGGKRVAQKPVFAPKEKKASVFVAGASKRKKQKATIPYAAASQRMVAKGQGPYGYLIEFGLALKTITPAAVRLLGLDPAVFAPDPALKTVGGYMGSPLAPPPPKPYNPADPIIQALVAGARKRVVTYRQLDILGVHPCMLPGAVTYFPKCGPVLAGG